MAVDLGNLVCAACNASRGCEKSEISPARQAHDRAQQSVHSRARQRAAIHRPQCVSGIQQWNCLAAARELHAGKGRKGQSPGSHRAWRSPVAVADRPRSFFADGFIGDDVIKELVGMPRFLGAGDTIDSVRPPEGSPSIASYRCESNWDRRKKVCRFHNLSALDSR